MKQNFSKNRALKGLNYLKTSLLKGRSISGDEQGNVLVISLILLVLLTMIGISASRTSSIDIQVAGNNMVYKRNLFSAEAAAYQAVQNLEETNIGTTNITWLLSEGDYNFMDDDNWGNADESDIDPDANATVRFIAVHGGVVDTGESLDMTRTKINSFDVYGRSDRANGASIVVVGYRKAY